MFIGVRREDKIVDRSFYRLADNERRPRRINLAACDRTSCRDETKAKRNANGRETNNHYVRFPFPSLPFLSLSLALTLRESSDN